MTDELSEKQRSLLVQMVWSLLVEVHHIGMFTQCVDTRVHLLHLALECIEFFIRVDLDESLDHNGTLFLSPNQLRLKPSRFGLVYTGIPQSACTKSTVNTYSMF